MKRFMTVFFVFALMFSALPLTTVCYAASGYEDNALDQAGDWFATLGKKDLEKNRILAERKAARMARHAEKEAQKAAKEAEKAGGDLKKKFGM